MTQGEIDRLYNQYAEYVAKVFRIELRRQRDAGIFISHDDEEELWSWVQSKIATYLPRFDPRKSALKTYLYTIVKSQFKWCLIRMRGMEGRTGSQAWNNSLCHYDDPDFEKAVPEPEQPRTVDDVLDTLPADLRAMTDLLLEGRTRCETALLLGWSRKKLQRRLAELKQILKGEEPETR